MPGDAQCLCDIFKDSVACQGHTVPVAILSVASHLANFATKEIAKDRSSIACWNLRNCGSKAGLHTSSVFLSMARPVILATILLKVCLRPAEQCLN
jgi:hypothetical protein